MNFLLLPLHLAEAMEATETSEGELGHALGQAGDTQWRPAGRKEGGRRQGEREAVLG